MSSRKPTVVGIDVGGTRKGFHAVALKDGCFVDTTESRDPSALADWCRDHDARLVAVDCPCKWSRTDSSRRAERVLKIGGQIIQCFKTPTRKVAMRNQTTRPEGKRFYDWIFNGEQLYRQLAPHYLLFDRTRRNGPVVFETFPHAVVCALKGKVVLAKPKSKVRRQTLRDRGFDISALRNIDFVDAALCALTAQEFLKNRWQWFGDKREGFIVAPA